MSEGYNGWSNYETWVVNLWMDNEQGSQDFIRETAKEIYAEAKATDSWTREESARFCLSDWLRVLYDENLPAVPGVYGDLLGGALGAVNWDEIARHHIDAILEEVTQCQ
jgi:hypothetical protein